MTYGKPYEMRAGQGSLFKNDNKTDDRHPNLKGKVMLPNGETRWISAWTKTTAAGNKWISLSIGDLVQQQGQPAPSGGYGQPSYPAPVRQAPAPLELSDDDIPF